MKTVFFLVIYQILLSYSISCAANASSSKAPLSVYGLQGSLRGTVSLQGRSDMTTFLKIQLYKPGETVATVVSEQYTDAQGNFSLESVIAGNYVVTVKGSHTLQQAAAITIASGKETILQFKNPLLEGDANDDNQVDDTDYTLLSKAFGAFLGSKGYSSAADFNADTYVSILDFSLLAENYGTQGYQIKEGSYAELSSLSRTDLFLLMVDQLFYRRYYASK